MPTSLAEGRLPETFGGWSEGRPLRAWLVTTHSGRLRASCRAALRPLCEVLARRAGANAGSRQPGPELRRSDSARNAAVERREARRPASLAGDPWRSRDRPDREAGQGCGDPRPAPVGALLPSHGVRGATGQASGAKRAARTME